MIKAMRQEHITKGQILVCVMDFEVDADPDLPRLTLGKKYEVVETEGSFGWDDNCRFFIIDDEGDTCEFNCDEVNKYDDIIPLFHTVDYKPVVTITQERLDKLEEDSEFLCCLQAAGVDNWDGYEYAQDMMSEEEEA